MAARLRADTDRRSPLRDLAGAKRLRLLAPQAVSPAPAADSSDRNGALASAPPLDSRATTASGSILRCAVPNSRPWSASRLGGSVQPNPQTRSCAPRPTSDRRSANKQPLDVDP